MVASPSFPPPGGSYCPLRRVPPAPPALTLLSAPQYSNSAGINYETLGPEELRTLLTTVRGRGVPSWVGGHHRGWDSWGLSQLGHSPVPPNSPVPSLPSNAGSFPNTPRRCAPGEAWPCSLWGASWGSPPCPHPHGRGEGPSQSRVSSPGPCGVPSTRMSSAEQSEFTCSGPPRKWESGSLRFRGHRPMEQGLGGLHGVLKWGWGQGQPRGGLEGTGAQGWGWDVRPSGVRVLGRAPGHPPGIWGDSVPTVPL